MRSIRINGIKITAWSDNNGLYHVQQVTFSETTIFSTPCEAEAKGMFDKFLDEALKIGDNVTVRVLSIKGSQVRLGIDAPKHIEVHREEIYYREKGGKK